MLFLLFLIAFLVFLLAGMLFFLGRFHKNPGGTTGVVPLIFQWYPFSGTLGDPLTDVQQTYGEFFFNSPGLLAQGVFRRQDVSLRTSSTLWARGVYPPVRPKSQVVSLPVCVRRRFFTGKRRFPS